jgi:hypothetical protein
MEKKFVLTEEESKRILTLHKKKIQEERENISEDTGQDIGRVAAGAGAGAATGAAVGSIVPVVGTAIGAVVGTVVGGVAGWFTTGGGAADNVLGVLKKCRTQKGNLGKTKNSDGALTDIADNIYSAVAGLGNTNLEGIERNLNKLLTIPDLCKMASLYYRRRGETLYDALDGDIDGDDDWRSHVWLPITTLISNTKKANKNFYLDKAKKCGFSSVEAWKKSGWKCNKKTSDGTKPPVDNTNPPVIPGGGGGRGDRYGFDYQEALKALKSKGCSVVGGGGSQDEEQFADDWRATQDQKVDTKISQDNIKNWAN